MDFPDFSRMSSEQMAEEAQQMICMINDVIAANQDNRKKEVGDKVVVWDGSGNIDKNTSEHRYGIDPLFRNNKAIVVATNQDVFHCEYVEMCHLDLLIVFPSGEEVYVSSEFVRIVD